MILQPVEPKKPEEKKAIAALIPPSDPLSGGASVDFDPLGASGGTAVYNDPLSSMPAAAAEKSISEFFEEFADESERKPDWSSRKAPILQKYTTGGSLAIASFMGADVAQQSNKAISRTQARLEQLDDPAESASASKQYSQKEYVQHMEDLNEEIARAWHKEERVRALKIAIQCAKLMGDTSVPQFYPSMFVLISEILDTFGRLVFERIKSKGLANPAAKNKQPHEFVPEDVTEEARETCRNWFYKIASIRELLPRIYVEVCIIRCYQFLTKNEFPRILRRLNSMVRGVGDPLVATHLRCYLARKGLEVAPDLKEYLSDSFLDFALTFGDTASSKYSEKVTAQHQLTVPEYFDLYSPSLEWIFGVLAHKASEATFKTVLQQYRAHCNNNSVVLFHILNSFKPLYMSQNVGAALTIIVEADQTNLPRSKLYGVLGKVLVASPPPEAQRLPLLNEVSTVHSVRAHAPFPLWKGNMEAKAVWARTSAFSCVDVFDVGTAGGSRCQVWKVITKLTDPKEYIDVAVTWIEYVLKYFSEREVAVLLKDLYKHVMADRAYDRLMDELKVGVPRPYR